MSWFSEELKQKALEMQKRNAIRFRERNAVVLSSPKRDITITGPLPLIGARDPQKMSLSMWQILGHRASQGDRDARQAIEAAKFKPQV